MAYDITNSILDKLIDLMTSELQTDILEDDPLYLLTIERDPLQEDPTMVSPLMVIGIARDPSRILDPIHAEEIGGGVRWLNYFTIAGQTAECDNKATAYSYAGQFMQRALRVIIQNHNLNSLVSDQGETVFGCTYDLIDEANVHVFGGESEWFGEFLIKCHYFTEETESMKHGN